MLINLSAPMAAWFHAVSRPAAAGILVALLAACDPSASSPANGADSGPQERGSPVLGLELRERDLTRTWSGSGPVEPRVRIRLASRTEGTVQLVHVDVGDSLEPGDLLAELDVSEERAELRRSQALAEEARLNHGRNAQLRERGVVSPADFQASLARLKVAESEKSLWQTRVEFGQVTAPRAAVVTARHIQPGEAVQRQDILFELSAMDSLIIRLGVSEMEVAHLRPGQSVELRLDALPELQLDAAIRHVAPAADPDSRLVIVEIALPEDAAEQGVRPGYLGRVRMVIDHRPHVLAVPVLALGRDDGKHYVYLIRDQRLQRREVRAGVTRGGWAEILQGLEAGDHVLASSPMDMRDGQAVRVVRWRD